MPSTKTLCDGPCYAYVSVISRISGSAMCIRECGGRTQYRDIAAIANPMFKVYPPHPGYSNSFT